MVFKVSKENCNITLIGTIMLYTICLIYQNHKTIFYLNLREKNLDTVTIIDATHMNIKNHWQGRCINSTSDLGSIYTFVFSPNPHRPLRSNCYYCVRFFARTVNVIEKIESK